MNLRHSNRQRIKRSLRACLSIGFCLALTMGCNRKEETEGLTGRYVNHSYLTDIVDSVAGLVPVYCYEMHFLSPNSVAVLYGFEEDTLSYRQDGNMFVLANALQDKDMKFKVNADKTITLVDSGWNNQTRNSVFKQSIVSAGKKWDFDHYLNQQMIAGKYVSEERGRPKAEVTFNTDGSVLGLGNFERYTVCYSGDCVGETYPIANHMTLAGEKENATYAFFRTKDTLLLRQIEAPLPDVKGERTIGGVAYRLKQL